MKVLISDKLAPEGIKLLEETPGLEVTFQTKWEPGELQEKIKDYHALIIRSATKVTKEVLEAADNLKVVGRAGIGVDNIDREAASKKGVVVMNTPTANTVTTAEHAMSMMMALARKIPQATASMKSGKWEKSKFSGVELFEKTLGVVGIGNIGSILARQALGLGMKVIAYDPFISTERASQLGVELVELDDLFARSDFISTHVPRTDQTYHLLRAENFAKMKDGVRIVNCARGGVVKEDDLVEAIKSGKVAGAALDVFEKEPLDPGSPLIGVDEIILTPHLGASTSEAQMKVATEVARQVADLLTKGIIKNAVNMPSVDPEALAKIQPYVELASRMGSFMGQLEKGRLSEVLIEYSGTVAEGDIRPLTATLLQGLLEPVLKEMVNLVNAPYLAKERGIKVKESSTAEAADYRSLITLTLKTDQGERSVAGTLYARKYPRIVNLDGHEIEVMPAGKLLVFTNEDKPGVIGKVGTLLGDNGVNIAQMQLGRSAPNQDAVAVLTVDTAMSEKVMEELLQLPFIMSATQLEL
jgi:D-3-phosphoglycerate dehydrogenase